MENYVSPPFPILNGTPQGSPLSPILSTLYTSSLLKMAKDWAHCDLSLYVDDRARYRVLATTMATTDKVRQHFETVLTWLRENSLQADPSKSELMVFTKT
jgi:hypothetical protein